MQPIITSFLLAFAFLSAVPSTSAGAQETSPNSQFPVECATRDVQLVAQLESYGMHSDIANEAFSTIMRARRACYDERVADGLALYDSIWIPTLAQGWW